jgi:hypothetical protein
MSYSKEEIPESEPPTTATTGISESVPPPKKKRESVKMTDKQKSDLNKHMEKQKKAGMSPSEMKSHRMKMMSRMRKGMTVNKAHKDIVAAK